MPRFVDDASAAKMPARYVDAAAMLRHAMRAMAQRVCLCYARKI